MSLGKQIRLKRLFSHPSGHLASIAIDHFTGYNVGLPPGLREIEQTLESVIAGEPDAVTMHRGIAKALWHKYAGKTPFILQSSGVRPDDTAQEQFTTIEDAVFMGADALAIVAYVRGASEMPYLKKVTDYVRASEKWGMPVISHVYPRNEKLEIVYNPEDIAWAVRCMLEVGVDIIKVPYCGDLEAHRQIIANTPVPVVTAGGPKTETMRDALQIMGDSVAAGAVGGTVGRNVWGSKDITGAVRAYKMVIHGTGSIDDALSEISS